VTRTRTRRCERPRLFGRAQDWVDIETLLTDDRGDLVEALAWSSEILGSDSAAARRLRDLGTDVQPDG
jgi:hypothetical protein